MPRAIDHVVHAAHDLGAQADFYRRIGFTVGARNHHPWGTENHIVQFPGHFIELIGRGPDFRAPIDLDPRVFSFAGFVTQELERGEGVSMVAVQAGDAAAVGEEFRKGGLGDFEPFHFDRRGKKADGSDSHVAFTLAFAQSRLIPHVGFFACQHHRPEDFFAPDWQTHANGALAIAGVVIVAENPAAHAEFLSGVTGQRDMLATSMGIDLEVADGQSLEILTDAAFRHRFGAEALADATDATRIAALRVAVRDLGAMADLLEDAGVAAAKAQNRLVIPPAAAFGVALAFEQATD